MLVKFIQVIQNPTPEQTLCQNSELQFSVVFTVPAGKVRLHQ